MNNLLFRPAFFLLLFSLAVILDFCLTNNIQSGRLLFLLLGWCRFWLLQKRRKMPPCLITHNIHSIMSKPKFPTFYFTILALTVQNINAMLLKYRRSQQNSPCKIFRKDFYRTNEIKIFRVNGRTIAPVAIEKQHKFDVVIVFSIIYWSSRHFLPQYSQHQ